MRITKKIIVAGAGVVALLAGGGAAAYAATAAPEAPKVTAEKAIELAHQKVQGAWVSEVDHDDSGKWEIELTKGTQVYEVAVDSASGAVTQQAAAQAEPDDDQGEADDD
ncbi:PepSY domain-containing protein [Actinomadura sp. ATCC 31491]|uniref:PepSY domain-containing protein n=1 Tax=Actinomadura luzonensis TaxID=2805427 RepID=A0ABT0G5I7_9ACTN|nr:PepSY domain-containing protein [Actinomadura luzonensis]MCK2219864.1 PepSY domain-containing protein [Actinomadura luzonensis]